MAGKKPRGLNALLSKTSSSEGAQEGASVKTIPVDSIKPNPFQPRVDFNQAQLRELIASVRQKGVLQPLLVRPLGAGYELIAGERRLRAAVEAELSDVPVIVMNISETESLEIAMIENLQREDLNALEVARGYRQMADTFGYSQEDIARVVGKSRSAVANSMRLLELPDNIQQLLTEGKLSAGHCRALLACKTRKQMNTLARLVISKKLSVHNLEAIIYKDKSPTAKSREEKKRPEPAPHILELERHMSNYFGTRVMVEEGPSKGRIIIEFYSNEDFERIMETMGMQ